MQKFNKETSTEGKLGDKKLHECIMITKTLNMMSNTLKVND